jgi:hypothetical protein
MVPNNNSSSRYIIKPKERIKILYKRLLYNYVKKYGIAILSLWTLSSLIRIIFDFHVPFLSILFIVALFFVVDLEYTLWLLASESLTYNVIRTIKAKQGNFKIPDNLYLLAMPFIDNIVNYISDMKKHNLLFRISLYNVIQKNSESIGKQEIIFHTCSFCTRLILYINVRIVITQKDLVTFDLGFMSGMKCEVTIHDENGNTLENMPKYKIDCIKETISKNILEEDIDIFCQKNYISVFDFLNSFFFVYWLAENYLLYNPDRKVLV